MNKPIKKIALILGILILLPGLFFTAFEINSLNQSEKVIEQIYNDQLDAILFSVNQYAQDVTSGWRSSLNTILNEEFSASGYSEAKIDSFLNINNSIKIIFFADSVKAGYFSSASLSKTFFDVTGFVEKYKDKFKRLYKYQTGGYYKIDTLAQESTDSTIILITLLNDPLHKKNICGMVVDPVKFIKNVLGPKINGIAREDFIITCSNINYNKVIFATDKIGNQKIQQTKKLWILPDYELGILLKGYTVETILKDRRNTSLILILILTLILLAGVFVVFLNIRKQVELAQIKSDFVSNVSHELRTPLALISMFAETLEMERVRTEEKKKEYYTIISKEANRLSRIVNKILSFSKIEAGKREYHFSQVNLNEITEEIFNTYKFHLQNSGFKFSFNKEEEDLPLIKADGEALSEAIVNLIDNAVKYSRDNKEINVNTGIEKNSVFVEIRDNGIGISDENQKKIFDKFYRVTEGLVYTTRGTGLGLTLVKHIIDAHQGEIKVRSRIEEGSSFKLVFPIK